VRTIACLCLALLVTAVAVGAEISVRPGDGLGISVLGEKDLTGKVMVQEDGAIALPLVGEVVVQGLTPTAIAGLLSERLAQYVKNPQVTVQIVERAPLKIVVSGAIRSPGVYLVPAGSRMAEALALAGGPTPAANLSQVSVVRAGSARVVDYARFLDGGDATLDPLLESGDTLRVAERNPELDDVRVIGKVVKPGAYRARDSLTPWDLITEAGGLVPGANPRQAMLKPLAGEPRIVDLTALLDAEGMAGAPVLKAGDTLVVPGFDTQVYILGGVVRPGPCLVQEGTRVLEAVAEAGGVTEFAVLDQAYIVRAAAGRSGSGTREPINLRKLMVEGDMALNVELRTGDALFIPVRTPGAHRPLLERAASVLAPLIYLLF